ASALTFTLASWTIAATKTIQVSGPDGSGAINAQLNNLGILQVNRPLTIDKASAAHTNSGTINVNGGNLTVSQSGTTPSFSTSGTITIGNGRTLTISGPS